MKLRNKKTGEIVEPIGITCINGRTFVRFDDGKGIFKFEVRSLAEFNKYWEDYEEDCYFINADGFIHFNQYKMKDSEKIKFKQIGNYFKTKEEAEQAVEKLKAWKRLKDKGFRLDAVVDTFFCLDIYMKGESYEAIKDDLKIVFGDENESNN